MPDTTHWWPDALCAQTDPDLWHPRAGDVESSRVARNTCRGIFTSTDWKGRRRTRQLDPCPRLEECFLRGLFEPHGIWGGTSAKERIQVRKIMGVTEPPGPKPGRIAA